MIISGSHMQKSKFIRCALPTKAKGTQAATDICPEGCIAFQSIHNTVSKRFARNQVSSEMERERLSGKTTEANSDQSVSIFSLTDVDALGKDHGKSSCTE